MNWVILDILGMEIEIISEFWVIGMLQYAEIYGKLNRRNKLWANGKLSNNNLDDKVDYSYLCGGYRNSREIINFIDNNLGSCKPACKPDLLRVYFERI